MERGYVRPMRWSVRTLRVLLGLAAVLLVLLALAVNEIGHEYAHQEPGLAHLRVPVLIACLVAMVPGALLIALAYAFLGAVADGEAFSERTLRILRAAAGVCGVATVYYVAGPIVFFALTGVGKLWLIAGWLVAVGGAVFLLVGFLLLERLVGAAVAWRADVEATV